MTAPDVGMCDALASAGLRRPGELLVSIHGRALPFSKDS